jgi:hypothetical protein
MKIAVTVVTAITIEFTEVLISTRVHLQRLVALAMVTVKLSYSK